MTYNGITIFYGRTCNNKMTQYDSDLLTGITCGTWAPLITIMILAADHEIKAEY